MKKIILGLLMLSPIYAYAGCDTIQSAVDYIKKDAEFSRFIGGSVSNIRFSNVPESGFTENKQILVVVDYKNDWSSGTLSNLILVNTKICKAKLNWSANLHTLP